MSEIANLHKNALINLLTNLGRSYGPGPMMQASDARHITDTVIEKFFIVPINDLPDYYVEKDTLTAHEHDMYVSHSHEISTDDSVERRYANVLATIANYLATEEIQALLEEKQKQEDADAELAFTLLKVADPYNLKYVNWTQVPRTIQDTFLTIARKAREELKD